VDWQVIGLLTAGFITLLVGGELLVRHSARFAALVGLSPLVIGLTVVAFGTSAPELAVSVIAGIDGRGDVTVGNVVGSNIFNVLFILGACAAISPLFVGRTLAWIDIPIMIGSALLAALLGRDGSVQWFEGALLIGGLAAYTWYAVRRERRAAATSGAETGAANPAATVAAAGANPARARNASLAWIVAGLGLLVLGSHWFVQGAVSAAQAMGVSELVIGLTIVAAGTSLPEVMTSILATIRGHREIAVGNVVGSNVFNVLGVLGISSVGAGSVAISPQVRTVDAPVMIATSLLLLGAVARGLRIGRAHGIVFLAGYAAYSAWLVLDAQQSTALPRFLQLLWWIGIPLVGLVLLRTLLSRRAGRPDEPAVGGAARTPTA